MNENPDVNTYSKVFKTDFEHHKYLDIGALRFEKRGPKMLPYAKVKVEYDASKILSGM